MGFIEDILNTVIPALEQLITNGTLSLLRAFIVP